MGESDRALGEKLNHMFAKTGIFNLVPHLFEDRNT